MSEHVIRARLRLHNGHEETIRVDADPDDPWSAETIRAEVHAIEAAYGSRLAHITRLREPILEPRAQVNRLTRSYFAERAS